MVRTMQDLLSVGVNAFAVRLLAKDFEKMRADQPMEDVVHVPIPLSNGKTIWVSFRDTPPEGVEASAPPSGNAPGQGG